MKALRRNLSKGTLRLRSFWVQLKPSRMMSSFKSPDGSKSAFHDRYCPVLAPAHSGEHVGEHGVQQFPLGSDFNSGATDPNGLAFSSENRGKEDNCAFCLTSDTAATSLACSQRSREDSASKKSRGECDTDRAAAESTLPAVEANGCLSHAKAEKAASCQVCEGTCGVCDLDSCRHQICRQCLQSHVSKLLESSPNLLMVSLTCPHESCAIDMSLNDLRQTSKADLNLFHTLLNSSLPWSPQLEETPPPPMNANCSWCGNRTVPHHLPPARREGVGTEPSEDRGSAHSSPAAAASGGESPSPSAEDYEARLCARCRLEECQLAGRGLGDLGSWTTWRVVECVWMLRGSLSQNLKKDVSVRNKSEDPESNEGRNSTVWASGTGYDIEDPEKEFELDISAQAEAAAARESVVARMKEVQREWDDSVATALAELREILEFHHPPTSGRRLPAQASAVLLQDKTLWRLLHILSMNDSVMDISDRPRLFSALLALLRGIAHQPELLPLVFDRWSDDVDSDGGAVRGSTVMDGLTNMQKGAQVALTFVKQGELDAGEKELLTDICNSVTALNSSSASSSSSSSSAHFHNNTQGEEKEGEEKNPTTGGHEQGNMVAAPPASCRDGDGASSSASDADVARQEKLVDRYKMELRKLQFREVQMTESSESGDLCMHHFRAEAEAEFRGNGSSIDLGRARRIQREFPTLATSLPLEWGSSIHVCVDESRPFLLKALIVGPEDTPYQNGLFTFDIYLQSDYPYSPPSVQFLTTGGGTVRFNPNLYECGKVCLSLLGTWSGPGWDTRTSTIMQVLVSIQSFILTLKPYYNEPGNERRHSGSEAEEYDEDVRLNTLLHAILPCFASPPKHFEAIVRHHLDLKRDEIVAQATEWVEAASPRTKIPIQNALKDLERAYANGSEDS